MIQNDEQLESTREALRNVESAMTVLKCKQEQMHPARFALMAEPIHDEIRRLRDQIDAYTGAAVAAQSEAPLWLTLEEARERIRRAVENTVRDEKKEQKEGVLREIDLDTRTFIVRDAVAGTEIRCHISDNDDSLLEIAKSALDYRVTVVGTRKYDATKRKSLPLQVREIDIIGRDGDDQMEDDASPQTV